MSFFETLFDFIYKDNSDTYSIEDEYHNKSKKNFIIQFAKICYYIVRRCSKDVCRDIFEYQINKLLNLYRFVWNVRFRVMENIRV